MANVCRETAYTCGAETQQQLELLMAVSMEGDGERRERDEEETRRTAEQERLKKEEEERLKKG